MDRDLVSILVSAALAVFNPSLLAAVTVMLLLPRPKRLMAAYLLGAYATSLAFGLPVVLSLHGFGALRTSRRTLSPGADLLIGLVLLAISLALETDRDAPLRRWRAGRKSRRGKGSGENAMSWPLRMLNRGSTRMTFLAGAALSLPGVSYVNALEHVVRLDPGPVPAVLLVVFFCITQQALIELPLLGYAVAPEWTHSAVIRTRAWLALRGRQITVLGLAAVGVLLIARGVTAL